MLDLGDLLTLVRLVQIEIFELQKDIDGEDEEARDDAGEVIIQTDALSSKLKAMYEAQWNEKSNYPSYDQFLKDIKEYPPFKTKR